VAACANHFFYRSSVLEVSGPDAESFLQGQFSNDLSIAGSGTVVYGLWLSLKGKILADSFILKRSSESFLIVCYRDQGAEIRDWLDGRLFMDEVELGEPRLLRSVSVWDANRLETPFSVGIPETGSFAEDDSVVMFWGRRDSAAVLEVLLGEGTDGGVFSADSRELSELDLAIAALKSEVYSVGIDILEDLPQEVGLDDVAVSYSKGCYVGQEVMARLKAMGRSRQAMKTLVFDRQPMGAGPWKLLGSEDRRVGELRRIVASGSSALGSALIRLGAGDGPFRIENQNAKGAVFNHGE